MHWRGIKVKSWTRAKELKKTRLHCYSGPTVGANQEAFKAGAIKEFERHSRLGFVSEKGFMQEIKRLRDLGFKRITLKTGAYSLVELAQALKFSSMPRSTF